jgi:hypothetical protein
MTRTIADRIGPLASILVSALDTRRSRCNMPSGDASPSASLRFARISGVV